MATVSALSCAYCGLPVARGWSSAGGAPEAAYCCTGCRFAAQVAGAAGRDGVEAGWMFTRLGLALFCTMNVMAFTMALWSRDVYGSGAASEAVLASSLEGLFRYLCLFFALPVLFWLGGPLVENAWLSLRRGQVTTDALLVAGVAASYLYSAHSVLRDHGPIYFEVGCIVLLLVTLGRWIEATGRARASQVLDSLERLLPEHVHRLTAGAEIDAALRDVQVGDGLRVRTGERIPCDGIVLDHAVHVDEQLLTGESGGRVKEPGDEVHAGTLNLDSVLTMEVTRGPGCGALSRMVDLIRLARQRKGRFEQLADRVTMWFLPGVGVIALVAAGVHGYRGGVDHGLLAGLAVLLIACPCALGIATPLAFWVAQAEAAAQGVLFQSHEAIERLALVDHFCFDKTGTLTTGQSTVVAMVADDPEALPRSLALAQASNHPHARAIVGTLDGAVERPGRVPHVVTVPGRGLWAPWPPDGERVFLGNLRLMRDHALAAAGRSAVAIERAQACGQSLVCVGWSGAVAGVFILRDALRPEATSALRALRSQGIDIDILTGDHSARALAMASALDIGVSAELLPEDKLAHLDRLRGSGKRVAMVGDGVNDGPALAASDVGVALGCGADVARDAAAVCLLSNDLGRLPWALDLARRTLRVVRQNLFFAFAYNVIGIGLAAAGLLNPVLAALAMLLSSGLVLANSLHLRTCARQRAQELRCSTAC